ncbi:hypothetical protein J1605_021649 [Eschrichtius robustus]|uniref:Uncharacterized protein n=1 Tax=Eschrichtius robustus TaxID=9764 RepID=A0AB34HG08_ESCRO|nr:hypothetical protein J1605_021649 [Eschrichtius robustus]
MFADNTAAPACFAGQSDSQAACPTCGTAARKQQPGLAHASGRAARSGIKAQLAKETERANSAGARAVGTSSSPFPVVPTPVSQRAAGLTMKPALALIGLAFLSLLRAGGAQQTVDDTCSVQILVPGLKDGVSAVSRHDVGPSAEGSAGESAGALLSKAHLLAGGHTGSQVVLKLCGMFGAVGNTQTTCYLQCVFWIQHFSGSVVSHVRFHASLSTPKQRF